MEGRLRHQHPQGVPGVALHPLDYFYRRRRDDQAALVLRLKELVAARVRYGYLRLHVLLRREG